MCTYLNGIAWKWYIALSWSQYSLVYKILLIGIYYEFLHFQGYVVLEMWIFQKIQFEIQLWWTIFLPKLFEFFSLVNLDKYNHSSKEYLVVYIPAL